MNLSEECCEKISIYSKYYVEYLRLNERRFLLILILVLILSLLLLLQIDFKRKKRKKVILILSAVASFIAIVSALFTYYEIFNIKKDILRKNWIEYEGELFFDVSKKELRLSSDHVIRVHQYYNIEGVSNDFYFEIPNGKSKGALIYLKHSKKIVQYIPSENISDENRNDDLVYKFSELHIETIKRTYTVIIAFLFYLSIMSIMCIRQFERNSKNFKRTVLIISASAFILALIPVFISENEIDNIRDDVTSRNWTEYSGPLYFDASDSSLRLVSDNQTIPLHSTQYRHDVFEDNLVGVPLGNSKGTVVFLNKTKLIVLFVPE